MSSLSYNGKVPQLLRGSMVGETLRVSLKKSLPWHVDTEIFSLIQGFMSCGLVKIGCVRGMFVLMVFPGHPLVIVSNKSSSG